MMPLNKSWHDYNESLIERGRILMDISFLESSKKEIKNMNKGKIGAPFEYSCTYIQFLAFLKIGFKIAYRTVQGIVRGLSDYIRIEEIHFTQIRRRILKIKPSVGNLKLELTKLKFASSHWFLTSNFYWTARYQLAGLPR